MDPAAEHSTRVPGAGRGVLNTDKSRRAVHRLFNVSVIVKGIDGVLEIIGGTLLFFITTEQLNRTARVLTTYELSEDPHDAIANYLLHSSAALSAGAKTFGALYLLWHGVVKVGLVTALLLRKLWAYPLAIVSFFLFLVYQLYRYAHTHSVEMLVLSVLDVFVIVLTWLEYSRLRALSPRRPSS
jgi:uncharacterized membrane protein